MFVKRYIRLLNDRGGGGGGGGGVVATQKTEDYCKFKFGTVFFGFFSGFFRVATPPPDLVSIEIVV